jgi:hypothetical protein
MSRKNWEKVAKQQFESLDDEIQGDWGELRKLTLKKH